MSVTWEWWGEFSTQRELLEFCGAPGTTGYRLVDGKPPKSTVGLTAKAVAASDVASIKATCTTIGATYTATLADGTEITGIPTSCTSTPKEHGGGVCDLKITLRTDGASPAFVYYGEFGSTKDLLEYCGAPGTSGYRLIDGKPVKSTAGVSAKGVDLETAQALVDGGMDVATANSSTGPGSNT